MAHWLGLLDEAGVPCAPVLRRGDIAANEQIIASGTLETIEQPGLGAIRQARSAARFEATPAAVHGAAPYLGEHTREILGELGFSGERIAQLEAGGVVITHGA